MIKWVGQFFAGIVDSELSSAIQDKRSLEARVRHGQQTYREFKATIESRNQELADSQETINRLELEVDRLEQIVAIKDDIIRELRVWVEEVQAAQEKRIAMHERARYLALRGSKTQDDADDFLS